MQRSFSRGGGGKHSLNFITRGILFFALLGGVFLFLQPSPAHAAGTPCSITPVLTEANLNTCIAEAPTDNSEFTITLGADFNITTQKNITAGKNITLTSTNPAAPAILTRDPAYTGLLFSLSIAAPSAATLTINSVIIDGNSSVAAAGYQLIYTYGAGDITVNLAGNTVLRNNSSASGGSAVAIGAAGNKLNISDNVQIINNATTAGGTIQVTGTLTMTGGQITGNTAATSSGGVFVYNGIFTMSGGEISNNTAPVGGGVYVIRGTFTMTGGKISDNTATAGSTGTGGGVTLSTDAVFNLSAGEITGNTADHGGGVYAGNDSTFTMTGGTISGNATLSGGGGGVLAGNRGVFNMSGGRLISNTASGGGGGLSVGHDGVANISGSTEISDNTADKGGGIRVNFLGTLTMTGGKITDNSASGLGNGIYFEDGSVILGGNAQVGSALGAGNGIYLDSGMIIDLQSGFTGFANIEGAADAYLGRPVAEGVSGYTASASDIARFKWLPADFALELNSATSQIVLGAVVPEAPGTGRLNSDPGRTTSSILSILIGATAISSVALLGRKLTTPRH